MNADTQIRDNIIWNATTAQQLSRVCTRVQKSENVTRGEKKYVTKSSVGGVQYTINRHGSYMVRGVLEIWKISCLINMCLV